MGQIIKDGVHDPADIDQIAYRESHHEKDQHDQGEGQVLQQRNHGAAGHNCCQHGKADQDVDDDGCEVLNFFA